MSAATVAFERRQPEASWSPDEWFAALDQRQIGAGVGRWVAHVLAVHPDRAGLWVQVAPADDPCATLVLHLSASTSLQDVLVALEHQSLSHENRPEIVDLSR